MPPRNRMNVTLPGAPAPLGSALAYTPSAYVFRVEGVPVVYIERGKGEGKQLQRLCLLRDVELHPIDLPTHIAKALRALVEDGASLSVSSVPATTTAKVIAAPPAELFPAQEGAA